ncbi:MAG: CocE/NonD family hydrolase [Proteobacteria bacterium]|nr:CocE/NonD family hydrolase [Pseudomonadota bacterium]
MAQSTREFVAYFMGEQPGPDFTRLLRKESVQIRTRDGVELHTEIYTPLDQREALPIILVRSPYGLRPDKAGYSSWLREYPHLLRDGYIFAFQDARGKGGSTGQYVTAGPVRDRKDPKATDESTDTYDTIDWLVKHVPRNNGRVGTLGISYGGFLVTRALVDPHPALKAASPQAPCVDMFLGDDFHHNGAFRLDYAFGWIGFMEGGFDLGALTNRYDHYDRFLDLGPLANINKTLFHGKAPSWNAFEKHPDYDDYWRLGICSVLPHIQLPVTVPTLTVGGWFDAEDHYGAVEAYRHYEAGDPKDLNRLVMGPWFHGGWEVGAGRNLGAIDFGSATAEYYREHIEAPWFAHWLKGRDLAPLPEVQSFRTGANEWKQYDAWPPKTGIHEAKLYLQAHFGLGFEAPPAAAAGADAFISDPAKPVAFMPRPISDNGWPEWQVYDQRFVDGRPDVLTYQTPPLTADLTITGEPVAHLFAATSGSDADWVVKLIDVYPDEGPPEPLGGFEFMLAEEVFRARYRQSFERPSPVVPNEVAAYVFSLRSRDHTFKAGHRIMVQVQSTWFPLIDANPQTYVPNIYDAVETDFRAQTHRVYRGGPTASFISLPVNER